MTELIWPTAKKGTLTMEGGYQCDPDDKGNWTGGKCGVGELKGTKYGISAMSYPHEDIKNLTKERAEYLYKRDYWDRCKCGFMPDPLSVAVFDYAINSGTVQAIKDLQRSLGVVVDGIIGNQTIGAANSKPLRKTLEDYISRRIDYINEISKKPKLKKYKAGWLNRVALLQEACEALV